MFLPGTKGHWEFLEYLPINNYTPKKCFEGMGTPVTWAIVDAIKLDQQCAGCGYSSESGTTKAGSAAHPMVLAILFVGLCYSSKRN